MKKILPVLALAAATIAGCADKHAFDVTVPVPEDYKGQTVVLLNSINGDTLGLATASDSLVTVKGTIEKPTLATVVCNSMPLAQLVVEPGKITMTDDGLAAGTPSNDEYAALSNAAKSDSADVEALVLDFMTKNPANPYTVPLFESFSHLADVTLIDTIVALNPDLKDNPQIAHLRQNAITRSTTSEGGRYVDFTLKDAQGKDVSLADYVSKAKLTVVDFWASWCGPCRAEIPNLINLYDQYKGNGLQVIGVDVWERDDEAGKKAVGDMKIPYPVMYGGTQEVTDLYGIMGIPTILVIDSEGKILARDIRGKELADFIAAHI